MNVKVKLQAPAREAPACCAATQAPHLHGSGGNGGSGGTCPKPVNYSFTSRVSSRSSKWALIDLESMLDRRNIDAHREVVRPPGRPVSITGDADEFL